MKRWKKEKPLAEGPAASMLCGQRRTEEEGYYRFREPGYALYDALRESVPIIDASIMKIIRLVGGYSIRCENAKADAALNRFLMNVPVGGAGIGLEAFLCRFLEDLLTYGSAVGEMLTDADDRHLLGLCNGDLRQMEARLGENPLEADILVRTEEGYRPVADRGKILFTALHPKPGEAMGCSLLSGLSFVTRVLTTIFDAMGQNFERCGNIRYAVTYHPTADPADRAFAKERAKQIAQEWSNGMTAARNGMPADFVSVGDVDIKVIGADSRLIETQIPVRQMLEEIIAKLGVPPFLLGLSWSTTERMSKQQADILASELSHYRRLLTPMILKICEGWLRREGYVCTPELSWEPLNLQDESEMAKAQLYRAQADKLRLEIRQQERKENEK